MTPTIPATLIDAVLADTSWQPDNRNAWKHGRYTGDAFAQRREVAALIRTCRNWFGNMRGL